MSDLEQITSHLIGSEYKDAALLSIEFWTTICDVETELIQSGKEFTPIIRDQSSRLTTILLEGMNKMDPSAE